MTNVPRTDGYARRAIGMRQIASGCGLRARSTDGRMTPPLTGGSVWRELEGPLLLPSGLPSRKVLDMASIARDANGCKRIQFVQADGSRPAIRLGKVTQRDAESFKIKLESLLSAKLMGNSPDRETSLWLSTLDDDLHSKLAAHELIEPRQSKDSAPVTVTEFVDQYIAKRVGAKSSTLIVYGRCRNLLAKFFKTTRLNEVTVAAAKDFVRWMKAKTKPLAENTARRMTGFARQFFNDAVERELIGKNPFLARDIKVSIRGNAERFHFVSRDDAVKVLEACPDAQWRLIFALSRFGGLRCPSEHLALTWGDVDWSHNRIRVPSPKTEHHEGKGERMLPLFPELRPHLEAAFDEAPEGTEFVITRYRDATQNMRTQFNKIVRRAGLTPWDKPFHNLRATRQTELSDEFPEHVVCQWLGNSQAVATKHYLHTTDEHFERAIKAAQKAAQSASELAGNGSQRPEAGNDEPLVLQGKPTKQGVGEVKRWTILDSNQRPPRCQRGALTN